MENRRGETEPSRRSGRALTEPNPAGTKLPVSTPLPPCPKLPEPRPGLDWRILNAHRDRERGAEFYQDCLEYAHALWLRGLAARALLCLDRAMGADLRGDEPILRHHPMPYAAVAWMIRFTPPEVFIGNPRVHYQHYADRVNEPRRELRRWRSWACWALARTIRPELLGDPKHPVIEPARDLIALKLSQHGLPGEADGWSDQFEILRALAEKGSHKLTRPRRSSALQGEGPKIPGGTSSPES